jgi:hypothetical protein
LHSTKLPLLFFLFLFLFFLFFRLVAMLSYLRATRAPVVAIQPSPVDVPWPRISGAVKVYVEDGNDRL